MKRKLFACLLMLLAGAASLMAQTRVTGTITDNTGYGVIGASVIEKGTTNGAIADLDGKYEITVRPGATLVFSSIGYKEQEIVVGNQTVINVLLLEDTELLDEVQFSSDRKFSAVKVRHNGEAHTVVMGAWPFLRDKVADQKDVEAPQVF